MFYRAGFSFLIVANKENQILPSGSLITRSHSLGRNYDHNNYDQHHSGQRSTSAAIFTATLPNTWAAVFMMACGWAKIRPSQTQPASATMLLKPYSGSISPICAGLAAVLLTNTTGKMALAREANRKHTVNSHWGGVIENNHFGTHEFLHLCELLDCEPYIAGNVGGGSPQEMQEWVEYMTFGGQVHHWRINAARMAARNPGRSSILALAMRIGAVGAI